MNRDWEDMAAQVINLCGAAFSQSQIIKDLKFTKSVESTVNRILDGLILCDLVDDNFLSSDENDPVVAQKGRKEVIQSQKCNQPRSHIDVVTIDSSFDKATNGSSDSSCQIVDVKPINANPSTSQQLIGKNFNFDLALSDELDVKITNSSRILSQSTRQFVLDFDDEDDLSFLNKPISPVFNSSQISLPAVQFPKKPKKRSDGCSNVKSALQNVDTEAKVECISEKKKQRLEEKAKKKALAVRIYLKSDLTCLIKEKVLQEKNVQSQIKAVNSFKQKKDCFKELVINICSTWFLEEKSRGIVQSLSDAGAVVLSKPLKVTYSMSLAREVNRVYDFEKELWIPCERKLESEPYILLLISSSRLMEILQQDMNEGLFLLFEKCSEAYPDFTIVWILEDLQEYYRKINSARAKKENDELRGFLGQNVRKRKQNEIDIGRFPDRKMLEGQLLRIQVAGGSRIRIHPCSSTETAGWIVSFAQQIAFFPEQYVRSAPSLGLNFGDSVKSGKGAKETWKRMLQQIPGISENVSNAITDVYPICADFMKQISSKSTNEAAALLIGIPVNTNGKSKSVGKITATRIIEVLMGIGPQ